ncbi:MFS transporter [Limobrevibacterium gyesilva]|uniref:MFS transporter n=1 Tax=Limobrevibacterium gyesilva TaxID=2991712 RepID=A0AA41YQ95_9PROT|nr:MFS transporter [Limobrevibacterium gyesilva]MCW3477699.1 MFS transporter [Limobrevibacterium gyesilva]
MSDRSLINLNWLNLFVAQTQTGFGAFLSVYLTTHMWTTTDIGFALSVGTVAVMVAQVPAGALVDAVPSKRHAAAAAIVVIVAAAMIIAFWPLTGPVLLAQVLQGAASCVLTPAIAAITLALAREDALGERLGGNVRFAAVGSGLAALFMGALGTWFSHRAILYLAAACGLAALGALQGIRAADLEAAATRTGHLAALPKRARKHRETPKADVVCDRCLLTFAACMALFHLGNAAVLPIAASAITRTGGHGSDLVVAATIIVPQALAALLSPRMGRAAQAWGRRPVLLLGFVALPLRALLFATDGDPYLMVAYQALDGISAAVLGVMVPLVVADITRQGGRFNLAMGIVGLAVGIGATLSTLLAGAIADRAGDGVAFVVLGAAGAAACLLAWLALPETTPRLARTAPRPA